jgi:hypothetical protein
MRIRPFLVLARSQWHWLTRDTSLATLPLVLSPAIQAVSHVSCGSRQEVFLRNHLRVDWLDTSCSESTYSVPNCWLQFRFTERSSYLCFCDTFIAIWQAA